MNQKQKFFVIVTTLVVLFLYTTLIIRLRRISETDHVATPLATSRVFETLSVPLTEAPHLDDSEKPTDIVPTNNEDQTAPVESPKEFYVSVEGDKEGDGSKQQPWPLQFVLNQPDRVVPGSMIWVRGGKYHGKFVSHLKGAEGKPIILRAYPGERAILLNDGLVLDISTSYYVNFWGLEITASENDRDPYERSESAYGIRINQGKSSHHIKFINMLVYDMPAQGFGWWRANKDSEIYGSVIFYNGVNQFDHGIYVNNVDGTKLITDNFIFDNASHGIHGYGSEDQELNNIKIVGNTVFNNGSIGYTTTLKIYGAFKRNILLGGLRMAQNPVISQNMTYYPNSHGESLNLGYRAGSDHAVVDGNYFAGGQVELSEKNTQLSMIDNSFITRGIVSLENIPIIGNTVFAGGKDNKVFIRPNQYETGRANITIYNWSKDEKVVITKDDLKDLELKKGDHYELRNVQDYFSDIIKGTYDGESIEVLMTGHSVAQPLGLDFRPATTFPEFGAFVLLVVNEPEN